MTAARDLPYPVRLAARFLPKPWGARRMETVLRRSLPGDGPVGESWEVFDRDGAASVVVGGPLAGRTLAEVLDGRTYPLLVKILDACAPLSVQVHPDEEAAARFGGEAKTECWFVLHAEPDARVYRGLRDGVARPELERALAAGEVESCLHSFPVEAGDTIFVPAGTVHTIGAGVLLAEVQQNSDTTYRLHDWGRVGLDGEPRELHVARALECIRFGPRGDDKIPMQLIEDEGIVRRVLMVKSSHFSVEHVTAMGTFTLETGYGPNGFPHVVHVLGGAGDLRAFDRRAPVVPFEPGATLMLPALQDAFELTLGRTVFRALVIRTG